ncbi:MAG: AAA family ATPase [Pseudomonadota bacterium]
MHLNYHRPRLATHLQAEADLSKGMDQRAMVVRLVAELGAQLVETPLSYVLLTQKEALKIKKNIRMPFVDYSSLAARHFFCNEELRLNKRFAPNMYLDLQCIDGSTSNSLIEMPRVAQDYAVRMQRLLPGALYSERLIKGRLNGSDVDALAKHVANFHHHAPHATTGRFGKPALRLAEALAALEGVESLLSPTQFGYLRSWLDTQAASLLRLWAERRLEGRVRECHGDLHLANIATLDGKVVAFDCLEFAPQLRWIDVVDDIAFAVMDFDSYGRRDFAFRLLNAWLDHTGDHGALPALRFSVVYRALVRAQVEKLRGPDRSSAALRYIETALSWAQGSNAWLFITTGLPGSGKTVLSQEILERDGVIRLRSDVERKRLFGLSALADSRAAGQNIYTSDATERTYIHLMNLALDVILAGFAVIVDAAFLKRSQRKMAMELSTHLKVPFVIFDCKASPQILRKRILQRRNDASEADLATLENLAAIAEPLSAAEARFACESQRSIQGKHSPGFAG